MYRRPLMMTRASAHDEETHEEPKRHTTLMVTQAIAGVVQLASAVGVLLVYLLADFESRQVVWHTDRYRDGETVIRQLESIDLFWLLLPVPFIAALFHGVQLLLLWSNNEWYVNHLRARHNSLRWLEYSITVSFMTTVIALLSFVGNVYLLFVVGSVLNVVMMATGYLYERLNSHKWQVFFLGVFVYFWTFAVIGCYFIKAAIDFGDLPWFVWSAFFGTMALYLVFPALLLWGSKNWVTYEVWFHVAGTASKLFLEWIVVLGVLL